MIPVGGKRSRRARTTGGTISGATITTSTYNGNTLTTGSSTYTGTAAQTYTFPTTSATIARTDAANTFAGTQTFSGLLQGNLGANVNGTVDIDNTANTTLVTVTGRNTHIGNAAVSRASFGNNLSATAFTIDVCGGNHATKASIVEIFNNASAALNLGSNAATVASITSTGVAVTGLVSASTRFNMPSFTVGTLPSAATAGGIIYVSDAAVAPCMAFTNGTNWKRCDNAATTVI